MRKQLSMENEMLRSIYKMSSAYTSISLEAFADLSTVDMRICVNELKGCITLDSSHVNGNRIKNNR